MVTGMLTRTNNCTRPHFQPLRHQKWHMVTYLFLIQMYMTRLDSYPPPQVGLGHLGKVVGENSWWVLSMSCQPSQL